MVKFSLHELACLDAVATEGSFQAAGDKLHRSHPSIHAALKSLEEQLGVSLLDRTGYRVTLTSAGESVLSRARLLLAQAAALEAFAAQISQGHETDLHVVIGALCPIPPALSLLQRFFDSHVETRLHLHFEAVSGPVQRLLDGEADLILHAVDKSDLRLEFIDMMSASLVPVAAPALLPAGPPSEVTLSALRERVQCVLRDSNRQGASRDHFLVDGARQWTVSDQATKKALIVDGMAWGHMPLHLVADELADGRLVSLEGERLRRTSIEIVAARLREHPHGPVAALLWQHLLDHAEAAFGATASNVAGQLTASLPRATAAAAPA